MDEWIIVKMNQMMSMTTMDVIDGEVAADCFYIDWLVHNRQ